MKKTLLFLNDDTPDMLWAADRETVAWAPFSLKPKIDSMLAQIRAQDFHVDTNIVYVNVNRDGRLVRYNSAAEIRQKVRSQFQRFVAAKWNPQAQELHGFTHDEAAEQINMDIDTLLADIENGPGAKRVTTVTAAKETVTHWSQVPYLGSTGFGFIGKDNRRSHFTTVDEVDTLKLPGTLTVEQGNKERPTTHIVFIYLEAQGAKKVVLVGQTDRQKRGVFHSSTVHRKHHPVEQFIDQVAKQLQHCQIRGPVAIEINCDQKQPSLTGINTTWSWGHTAAALINRENDEDGPDDIDWTINLNTRVRREYKTDNAKSIFHLNPTTKIELFEREENDWAEGI